MDVNWYLNNYPVITDQNWQQFVNPVVDGETKQMGCVQRDYQAMPYGSLPFAGPYDMDLIPEAEWDDLIADQERNKSSLQHIRERWGIKSLDQDGYGYCWAFSTVKAVMLLRALQNEPDAGEPLSAWAVAAIIKNYRDQGGWCQQSLEWIVNNGVPSLKVWPQRGVDRKYDTAEMRADAAKRKVTEWMDMEGSNKYQLASNLLRNIPTMVDGAMPGHSVCALRLISRQPFRYLIDNSWSPTWGNDGMSILTRLPSGQAAPRVSNAA